MDYHALIGTRIEIPAHYDRWMQGAKYGKVIALKASLTNGNYLLVQMDNPKAGRVKVWSESWQYIRVIERGLL